MKKNFYLLFLLTAVINLSAQTPGGVSGSVLWLKANTDASSLTWTDKSSSGNDFTQTTVLNQPTLASNVFNFNPAMNFDGINSYMAQSSPVAFPTGNSDRSIFVVANATATDSYRWILAYGTPGYPPGGGTCQIGNKDATLISAFYGSPADFNSIVYWDQQPNLNGAVAAFTMASNQETLFDKSLPIAGQLTAASLTATSTNAVIGAVNDLSVPAVSQFWSGAIAEVIMFPTALSSADRNKVESYLALKYGFTLGNITTPTNYTASDGTIFWTASTTFQNDVFGIGTDATGAGLTQTVSNSSTSGSGSGAGQFKKGNLTLSVATALTDGQFLLIGNDAGFLDESAIFPGQGSVAAEGSLRLGRNWKVQNTGSVGAVDLSFDTTGLLTLAGGTTLSNYILMIDNDGNGNYADGPQTYISASSSTGNKLNFTGITLPNNAVFAIITSPSAALPAIWQGFTATVQKNKATLTWKTSNEINVDHYTVEYSTNGINFLTAGTVVAKNGAGINTYTLTQDNLPAGIRYYRIKRVDKDGKFEISETKSVKAGGAVTLVLKSNPLIKGRIELNIDVPQNQDAMIRVVNVDGKILLQQNYGLSTGTNSVTSNVSHIAAGTYFLQVQLANEIINKKFVKL